MNWMRVGAVVFIIGMVTIIVCADIKPELFSFIYLVPGRDKAGHLLLMAVLSFFVNGAVNCQRLRWKRVSLLMGSFLLVSLMLLEETSQLLFPGRTFSSLDMLANICGIAIGDRFALLLHRYQSRKESRQQFVEN
ncbi:VanZ family protein [candidate division KSB1 bacterium]|nr:VanZ family protein [candidate division KSB1 bacterium]